MKIFAYRQYEYERDHLLFVSLDNIPADKITYEVTLEQRARILKRLNSLYGDTPQETTEWALEYELWCRMLLMQNALCLNPKHLDITCDAELSEVVEQILLELPTMAGIKYMRGLLALDRIIAQAPKSENGGSWFYVPNTPAANKVKDT